MASSEGKKGFTSLLTDVFLSELEYIARRRDDLGLDSNPVNEEHERLCKRLDNSGSVISDPGRVAPQTDIRPSAKAGLVGLALSGGGIRSATFNLGLLQGLARRNVLRCCDYLSTVSGGGYIGSCLSSLLDDPEASVEEVKFPFRFQRKVKPDERKAVKHLREHGNYLAVKGSFLEYAGMLGTYLSGLILSNLFPVAVLIFIGWGVHALANNPAFAGKFDIWCFTVSLVSLGLMAIIRLCGSVCWWEPGIQGRRNAEYLIAALAGLSVISVGMGFVTLLAVHWVAVEGWVVKLVSGVSVVSALGLSAGLVRSRDRRLRAVLRISFKIGWVLILPVLFAWLLHLLATFNAYEGSRLLYTLSAAAAFLTTSMVIDTNRTSLHHFYRDRLSEAYIIKLDRSEDSGESGINEEIVSNESLRLSALHQHGNGAPYHLINTTLNVPASTDRYLRGRGADLFFFSKNYVGSEATGYRKTAEYKGGRTRLAKALAISGAAASPQMGTSSNKALRALLSLLNVRLNRWMPNPNPAVTDIQNTVFWPWYFLKELFGVTRENDKLLNLSDGGHHENLGVYPLLKRRCRIIIASDATADPDFSMSDLANVIRKARIDLGVNITLRAGNLRPDPGTGLSGACWAVGDILYPSSDPAGAVGTLIYIKSAVCGNEAEDLLAYRKNHPAFPDQSTGDQFFDEAQFESYRKLGETTALDVFRQPFEGPCFSNAKLEEIRKVAQL